MHHDEQGKASRKGLLRIASTNNYSPAANKRDEYCLDKNVSVSLSSSVESLASSDTIYPDPPDGGYGWVVVLAAFLSMALADGLQLCVGIIYAEMQDEFDSEKGESAIISAIFLAVPLLAAPLVSPIIDAYDCRATTIAGGLITAAGIFLSVWAPNLLVLSLTFGLITGVGLSFIYSAPMIAVTYYFDRKRAFATGVAAAGSGFGTVVFAPVCELLFDTYGWKGTLLILSAILLNLVVCGCLIRDLEWPEDTLEYKTDKFLKYLDSRAGRPSSKLSHDTSISAATAGLAAPGGPINLMDPWHAYPNKDLPLVLARNAVSLVELPCFIRAHLKSLASSHKGDHEDSVPAGGVNLGLERNWMADLTLAPNHSKSVAKMPFEQNLLSAPGTPENLQLKRIHRISASEPEEFNCSVSSSNGESPEDAARQRSIRSLSLAIDSPFHPKIGEKLIGLVDHSRPSAAKTKIEEHDEDDGLPDEDEEQELAKRMNGHVADHSSGDDPFLVRSREKTLITPLTMSFATSPRGRGMSALVVSSHADRSLAHYRAGMYHLRSQLAFSRYNAAKRVLSAPELKKVLRIQHEQRSFRARLKRFIKEAQSTLLFDVELLKMRAFLLFFIGNLIMFLFNDIPYVNVPDYAARWFTTSQISLLVSVLGFFQTLGMVVFGIVADRKLINPCCLMAIATGISGLAIFIIPLLPAHGSFIGLAAVNAVFGFFMGASDGVSCVILVEMCGLSGFVHAYGLVNFACGIGNLVGPTLAGYLYDWTNSYDATFITGGAGTMLAGVIFLLVVPLMRRSSVASASRRRRSSAGHDYDEQEYEMETAKDCVQITRKQPLSESTDQL